MENKIKLHYSKEPIIEYRYRKVKSVIEALGVKVVEEPKELFVDLRNVCPIPTLPILETPEGNFSYSNTIIRYLASVNENKLYGGDNLHDRALIDQWLDLTTCDFDICCLGAHAATHGKEVDIEKLTEDAEQYLSVLNKHLKNRKFLVGESLSVADLALAAVIGPVLNLIYGENERKRYGPLVAWYQGIAEQNKTIEPQVLGKNPHKKFDKNKKDKGEKNEKNEKEDKGKKNKQQKGKKQKKDGQKGDDKKQPQKKVEEKKEDDDDLFGDDDKADASKATHAQNPALPKNAKPAKAKPVAKSIVVFDVKVYEQEQDLNALFNKIKENFVVDGLVWNNEPKILPVAFGMNKLQMGCVIEDAKVSVQEDVFEKLREWEDEIQSVDVVSFQKL